ncbi:MAG: cytochrome c peroxidase [Acidobacteriota bacterium]
MPLPPVLQSLSVGLVFSLVGLAVAVSLVPRPALADEAEANRLPAFVHTQAKGLAAGWDGRLLFDAKYLGTVNGALKYGWTVRVMRPEAIGTTGDPYADLQNASGLFSPPVVFDWDVGSPGYGAGPSQADGRLHLAAYPDPSFEPNPYRSDASGAASATDAYETYRLKVVGKYTNILASTIPLADQDKILGRTDVRVVVSNPRSASAAVHSATTLSQARLLKTGSTILHGYEPTLSMDGRLLIWQGHPNNDLQIRFLMYSYNPNPHAVDGQPASVEDTGWSTPRSVSAMYWRHGPGAAAETLLPDGTLFSDAYPIARRPLVVHARDGGVTGALELDESTSLPGAYPWLSWDASELFFPITPSYKATLRNAFSVIGARTGWRLEHVDGPVNWTRGNVTDSVSNWVGTPAGDALKAAYEALSGQVHPSSLGHPLDYETILLAPLALGHSMWSPRPGDPSVRVPYFGGRDTYALITSHSGRYFEVPLFRERDGRFLASFPFNEGLILDVDATRQLEQTSGGSLYWLLARDAVTYASTTTLDVSGQGLVGTLQGGAAFPYDYRDARTVWQTTGVLEDFTEGLRGNAIYFPAGSFVESTLDGAQLGAMAGAGWSISVWLRPLVDLTGSNFRVFGIGSDLLYLGKWGSQVKLGVRDEATAALLADMNLVPASELLSAGAGWHHLAVSQQRGALEVYVDGVLRKTVTLPAAAERHLAAALTDGQARRLEIGPATLAGGGTDAKLMIDEVDLLSAPLDQRTLRRLAFAGPSSPPSHSSGLVALGRQLFFDARLSANQTLSCATCHRPDAGYGDQSATSPGVYGRSGARNAPALAGSVPSHAKMLTASTADAGAQWLLPLAHEREMGVSLDVVLSRLTLDADLVADFQSTLGAAPSADTIGTALAAYVESISRTADLDHPSIVDHPGRALFLGKARCSNCHSGSRLSDGHLHAVLASADPGRQSDTGLAGDQGKFKTAPLIDLDVSAPYFHDGSASTLTEVVEDYNDGFITNPRRSADLRPLGLDAGEIADLASFLEQIPTATSQAAVPSLANAVTNLGVGCTQRDCFWMIVDGTVPTGVTVEVRDTATGGVLQTLTPSRSPNGATTSLTGRLTGSVLSAFQSPGVLLNLRYPNENGRIVRSGPRFIRSDASWPGAASAPSISAAGKGCGAGECIWISATGLDPHTVVELSDPPTGEVVALYSGTAHPAWGHRGANVLPTSNLVTLAVDSSLWPVFATTGLRVRLINRHYANPVAAVSNETVVTSPGLGGF